MSTDKNADAKRAWRLMSEMVVAYDRKERVAEELGLSFARTRALRRLLPAPLTLRDLADVLNADPPYVTLIIDDLEDRGLVTREPHPSDRRAKLVTLSAEGRKLATKADQILATPPETMARLSKAELESLLSVLEQLHE
jgi:DNA-binding MarR family transcriptional regulator